jgi:hypothetical protein
MLSVDIWKKDPRKPADTDREDRYLPDNAGKPAESFYYTAPVERDSEGPDRESDKM